MPSISISLKLHLALKPLRLYKLSFVSANLFTFCLFFEIFRQSAMRLYLHHNHPHQLIILLTIASSESANNLSLQRAPKFYIQYIESSSQQDNTLTLKSSKIISIYHEPSRRYLKFSRHSRCLCLSISNATPTHNGGSF